MKRSAGLMLVHKLNEKLSWTFQITSVMQTNCTSVCLDGSVSRNQMLFHSVNTATGSITVRTC